MVTLKGTTLTVGDVVEDLSVRRKAAEIHDLVRRTDRALRGREPEEVVRLAERLVRTTFTGRTLAYLLLGRGWGSAAGIRTRRIEALADGIASWHHSDVFCFGVATPAWREGRLSDAAVRRWARSDDELVRRNALVSTIKLGDVGRTVEVCALLAADRDPVVAKALSWALRELIRHDRGAVERFLEVNDVRPRVRREVRTKLETGRKR